MGTPYTVRSGDTLSRIAQQNGYSSWQEIYNHPDNADFRRRRPNPNQIHPGDQLILPDRGDAAPEEEPEPGGGATPEAPGGGPAEPAGPVPGVAARRAPSADTTTVLSSLYELREIVVAQGIEHLNRDPWLAPPAGSTYGYQIPRGLEEHLPNNAEHEWVRIDDTSAEFLSHAQRVRYRVRVITSKDEYKRSLLTPGLHVVYMGHSRYGRGQCFGPNPSPGDNWEQGTDTNTAGLFRTGYPVVGVHLSELREHGYKFYPVGSSTRIDSSWYHPEINRGNLHRLHLPDDLQDRLLPQAIPPEESYWGSRDGEGETLLLWAGWEDTISNPMDLGATDPLCRCWCIFSCSTRLHYWKIVRRMKNWRRTETDRFAYFTTSVSYPLTTWAWLRAVFEYSVQNDNRSWYPSLEWAKRRCGRILREERYSYGIY